MIHRLSTCWALTLLFILAAAMVCYVCAYGVPDDQFNGFIVLVWLVSGSAAAVIEREYRARYPKRFSLDDPPWAGVLRCFLFGPGWFLLVGIEIIVCTIHGPDPD